ncbi:hypothetical protein Taro_050224, partial [Colocasia esculenta]|nr:hypothetical protein [Colocasia esculenta]
VCNLKIGYRNPLPLSLSLCALLLLPLPAGRGGNRKASGLGSWKPSLQHTRPTAGFLRASFLWLGLARKREDRAATVTKMIKTAAYIALLFR